MKEQNKPSVAIIGGGASGLAAAIAAARQGAAVSIFERNDRVGKKILVTGNGRCNLTNRNIQKENYHGSADFAAEVIGLFDLNETLKFFEELGLEFYTDGEGRVFPAGLQAAGVLDVLRFELDRLGVEVYTNFSISSIGKKQERFEVISQAGKSLLFDRVILCCGGKADPGCGSDGNGFQLAVTFGHRMTDVFPALSQLRLGGHLFKAMERMKWEALIRAVAGPKVFAEKRGDILFSSYGISGTAVLSISRKILELLAEENKAELEIDLFPDLDETATLETLVKRRNYHPERKLEDFFTGWLNKRIGQTLVKSLGFDLSGKTGELTDKDLQAVADRIHHWRFEVTGHNGWQNAQVTAGGIRTEDVDVHTLQSKLVQGLFFAGEILDVDGDSGGYNLQWAWSSGIISGLSASEGNIK